MAGLSRYHKSCRHACELTKNQLEDVVEYEVVPGGISHQLEDLREVHGPLLLVNLVE